VSVIALKSHKSLSHISRCKQFRLESTFKTSKAASRSTVYTDSELHTVAATVKARLTRSNRSEY